MSAWTAKPVGRLGIVVRRMAGAAAVRAAIAKGYTVNDAAPEPGRLFPSFARRAQMEAARPQEAAAERHRQNVETLREEFGYLVRDHGMELRVVPHEPGDPTVALAHGGRIRLWVAVSFANVAVSLSPVEEKLDLAAGLDLDFLLLAHGRASTAQLAADDADVMRTNVRQVALTAADALGARELGDEYRRARKLQARAEPLATRVPRQIAEVFGPQELATADDERAVCGAVEVNWDAGRVLTSVAGAPPQIRELPRIDPESVAAALQAQLRSAL